MLDNGKGQRQNNRADPLKSQARSLKTKQNKRQF